MSFKIIPVDELPEKPRKAPRDLRLEKTAGKELNNDELWEIGWMMWKMGSLYRFKIKGVCDMNTEIEPSPEFTVNNAPRAKRYIGERF